MMMMMQRCSEVFLFHHKVQYSAVYLICFSPKARKSATAATAASAPAEKAQKIEGHRSQRWFMLVLWFRCGKCAHVSEIGEMLFNCDLFTCRVFRVKGWRQLNQRFVEVHYQADVQQRTACRIVALKNGSFFFLFFHQPSLAMCKIFVGTISADCPIAAGEAMKPEWDWNSCLASVIPWDDNSPIGTSCQICTWRCSGWGWTQTNSI